MSTKKTCEVRWREAHRNKGQRYARGGWRHGAQLLQLKQRLLVEHARLYPSEAYLPPPYPRGTRTGARAAPSSTQR